LGRMEVWVVVVAGSVCGECPGGSGSAVAQPEERHCGTIGEFAVDVGERSAVPHVKGGKLRPAFTCSGQQALP
jgi:hypothetical protein